MQLVSALLPCRCDNACELPESYPRAVSDNQGFVNPGVLCVWHWGDVTVHSVPVCSCKMGQLDGKVDNLEPSPKAPRDCYTSVCVKLGVIVCLTEAGELSGLCWDRM